MSFLKKIENVFATVTSRWFQKKTYVSSPIVFNAFKLKYPNANSVQWQQNEISRWTVNFTLNNKWYSALFDSQGNWLDTMSVVSMESIPKNVQENFEKSFERTGIKNIHQIETNTKTIYEFKWTNGVFNWKLLYDISGKMVGRVIS